MEISFRPDQPASWQGVNPLLKGLSAEIRLILNLTRLYLYGSPSWTTSTPDSLFSPHAHPLTGKQFSDDFLLCLTRKVIEQFHQGAGSFFRGVYARGTLAFFSAFPHTAQIAGIVVTRPMIVRVAPTALR